MKPLVLSGDGPSVVALSLLVAALVACSDPTAEGGPAEASATSESAAAPVPLARPDFAALLAEVDAGRFDPVSVPMETGIVWYGTWEDAVAESERTGKPVMLHFGSPRCPGEGVCVPGTW